MTTATETIIHRWVEEARAGRNPRVVARMTSGWAVLNEAQFLRGACMLLPDPVVGSLNALTPSKRAAYLDDMSRLGDALLRATEAERINYAILGNVEPALHAHVVPRYADEPPEYRRQPHWSYPTRVQDDPANKFSEARHAELRDNIVRELHAGTSPAPKADVTSWQSATCFAARAHQGQLRKDGVTPYAAHPYRVAMTVRDLFGCDDPVCIAGALLHDTIEDTPADYDDILGGWGADVADCVAALTKDMRLREDQREPAYDRALSEAGWRAALVKLADVFDNLSDTLERKDNPNPAKMVKKCQRAVAIARPHAESHPAVDRAIRIVEEFVRSRTTGEA